MTKERLEDLGRIRERLSAILESEVFEDTTAAKFSLDQWGELGWQTQEETLRLLFYGREALRHELWDIFAIAKGEDE